MTICAHNSSLISLIANSILEVSHEAIESDKELTKTAMLFLEDRVKHNGRKKMSYMRDALKRLEVYADLISQKTTHEETSSRATSSREEPDNSFLELAEFQFFDREVPTPNIDSFWGFI